MLSKKVFDPGFNEIRFQEPGQNAVHKCTRKTGLRDIVTRLYAFEDLGSISLLRVAVEYKTVFGNKVMFTGTYPAGGIKESIRFFR